MSVELPVDPLFVDEPEPEVGACRACEKELYGNAAARALCQGCERSTTARLEALPALYEALGAFLQPGTGSPGPRPTHGAAGPRMPLSERVLTLLGPGGAVGVLEDWRAALHSELDWTPPRVHGVSEKRVMRACRGLRLNMPWIAGSWEQAGDLVREIRELHGEILGIVMPDERGMKVGACPALVGGSILCGATLRATPGAQEITCPSCGCRFGSHQWLQLRRWQLDDEQAAAS